jgi:hypothetical protein
MYPLLYLFVYKEDEMFTHTYTHLRSVIIIECKLPVQVVPHYGLCSVCMYVCIYLSIYLSIYPRTLLTPRIQESRIQESTFGIQNGGRDSGPKSRYMEFILDF